MIISPYSGGTPVVSLQRFAEDAAALKALLQGASIRCVSGSPLSDAIDAAKQIAKGASPDEGPIRAAQVAGAAYLGRLVLAAEKTNQLKVVQKHLKYLADPKANPLPTVAAKNLQARNMVFELEVACLAAHAGFTIAMADEPDVSITDSPSWDIACKAIESPNPVTIGDRVEEGIEQVLHFNNDYGLVVFGVTNRVGHEHFLPLLDPDDNVWGSYTSFGPPVQMLKDSISRISADITRQAATRFHGARNATKFRGVLLLAHTVSSVNRTPTLLTVAGFCSRGALFGTPAPIGPEEEFAKRITNAAHTIIWG